MNNYFLKRNKKKLEIFFMHIHLKLKSIQNKKEVTRSSNSFNCNPFSVIIRNRRMLSI